jgi:hypothetical protein
VRELVLGGLFTIAACSSNGGGAPAPVPSTKVTANASPEPAPAAVAPSQASGQAGATCPAAVRGLGPGMTHERVALAGATPLAGADDCLDVVRIDLGGHRLRILSGVHAGGARAMPAWLADEHLVAGINAGMFHDTQRSVGMLVTPGAENNPDDNPAFGGFLAFDPVDPASPPVVVAGRDCPGFDLAALRGRYRSIAQSYRLVGCEGEAIAWKDPKFYSAAAIGVDRADRLVLLHARAPHRMRDVSATAASLDLAGAIFVEGGPEATLIVNGRDGTVARVGSYETAFLENDANQEFWQLPNVIGVARLAR